MLDLSLLFFWGAVLLFLFVSAVLAGEVVPYLSYSLRMPRNEIMGNIRFGRVGCTKGPMSLTAECCRRNTSRVIILSVATSRREHTAVTSIVSELARGMFVPVYMNKKVEGIRSCVGVLETNTSGYSAGATTVGGPRLLARTSGIIKSRTIIVKVSTGEECISRPSSTPSGMIMRASGKFY